jgi:hypothetical protein
MRYILMFALFFTCLSAASAADDPITKPNNDANTRVPNVMPPVYRPPPPVDRPTPEDLAPRK